MLEASKNKGLKPLLKFLESNINAYIIEPLTKDYEFVFTGVEEGDEL